MKRMSFRFRSRSGLRHQAVTVKADKLIRDIAFCVCVIGLQIFTCTSNSIKQLVAVCVRAAYFCPNPIGLKPDASDALSGRPVAGIENRVEVVARLGNGWVG